ncbi:serine/threonine protein kinase [Streptomyces sp. MUSC 14]|uniref:serine/threonine-protein kinase n=1 Tax=Streptomyces sp. MUSC 14 TaxID=1354889 RepID=UPI0008F55D14|nr:serine/threonine-protein kinase [Streptomyces sp. MUSC 14]OIJ95063.1 serine/threonine protein kinase [Streptomyces sp. MUSC 14]
MEKLGPGDPQLIGGYRLLARLGAGGMGHVYLARSDRGRTVAVKLVREELAREEEFRARFRQEVAAARRVGGYWTAPVLDADTEAAVPWVATGYVAGPSLQQVVGRDHGALPERSVRILAAGLAHALKDIHAAGIVHRDLKPSNVLVTIDGPRVIDFGIARALETASPGGGEEGLTRTGALVGSPGFMAPEQVRGDPITPACDVFCLGSVLAYAATGALPFGTAGSGGHALMFRIAQEEPDLTGVPEGIADLVRGCLRKDPAARPSLDVILERTGAEDTVSGGRSRDPWLPGVLVAQLGRHAVQLLEVEEPTQGAAPALPPGAAPASPPAGADGAADGGGRGGSPEHAAASDEGDGGETGGGGADRLPTVVAGQAPVPGAPPAPAQFGYGQAQQHPQPVPPYPQPSQPAPTYPQPQGPGGYGYPQQTYPSYDAYGGGSGSAPEEERRSGRSTVLLVVIALIVALGAGGSVYALMNGGGQAKGGGTPSPGVTSAAADSGASGSSGSGTPAPSSSPSSSVPSDGAVPAGFLGDWRTSIDSSGGVSIRELTIRQGQVGDTVLTLVADGPTDGGGTYHCVFEAKLVQQPSGNGPLEVGPSTVSSGEPASSCTPGAATEITLLPGDALKRQQAGGGESLTYTKQ